MRIPRSIAGGWDKLRGREDGKELMQWADRLISGINYFADRVTTALNGNLSFGDGTDTDNITGKWLNFTSNATPGAETAVTHDLGVIPVGFLMMIPPANGTWNKGPTAWTTTQLFITFSAASQTVRIFALLPSSLQ